MAATREYTRCRRITGYPPPKYRKLFSGYMIDKNIRMSEAATTMIIRFFDAMPDSEKRRLSLLSK
jgi:hypothetical protein